MAVKKLTETSVARMIENSLYDTEVKGFAVRQRKTGRFFCLEYKSPVTESNRKITIGKHGTITVEQARSAAKKIAGHIALGNDPLDIKSKLKRSSQRKKQSTLRVFLQDGFKHSTPERTYHYATSVINNHFVHLLDLPMSEITPWHLEKWKRAYPGKASGANRIMTSLRGVLSKAVKAGLIDKSPMPEVKNKKEDKNKKIRFLSYEEEHRLLAAIHDRQEKMRASRLSFIGWCKARGKQAPPLLEGPYTDHIKPMVLLALNTGLRRGEIFNLKVKDLDFTIDILTVTGDGAKSGQTRQIPLNAKIRSALHDWLLQTEYNDLVFPSPVTGNRFDNIKTSWEQVKKMSGLQDIRFHDLRHTFGTRLAHNRIDLVTIKDLMGHESLDTTARYLHTSNELKMKAVMSLQSDQKTC
ncbi:MAG: tyrosine-type recombinase/integrase [Endozoicomonas sp.]